MRVVLKFGILISRQGDGLMKGRVREAIVQFATLCFVACQHNVCIE